MSDKQLVDFFQLFFTQPVIELIHTETNRYAQQQLHGKEKYLENHPHARGNDWLKHPMTLCEVKPFLALLITMGVVGLPTIR